MAPATSHRLPDGTEVRHGHTFAEWCDSLHEHLKRRFRRNHNPERRAAQASRNQPLWDYWASGYNPHDAALDM